jgi:hypothetical protein
MCLKNSPNSPSSPESLKINQGTFRELDSCLDELSKVVQDRRQPVMGAYHLRAEVPALKVPSGTVTASASIRAGTMLPLSGTLLRNTKSTPLHHARRPGTLRCTWTSAHIPSAFLDARRINLGCLAPELLHGAGITAYPLPRIRITKSTPLHHARRPGTLRCTWTSAHTPSVLLEARRMTLGCLAPRLPSPHPIPLLLRRAAPLPPTPRSNSDPRVHFYRYTKCVWTTNIFLLPTEYITRVYV